MQRLRMNRRRIRAPAGRSVSEPAGRPAQTLCRAFPAQRLRSSRARGPTVASSSRPRRSPGRGRRARRSALDQHRAARPGRSRLARGALRLPPAARLRGRPVAQPATEDRRGPRLPVHRPALPGVRQDGRAAQRGRAGHLHRPRLPDHAAELAAAAGGVPVRALPLLDEVREAMLSKGRATCSTRSSTTPSTTASRCCARSATSSSGSRRRSSRGAPRRSCATSPTPSRRSSTSAR